MLKRPLFIRLIKGADMLCIKCMTTIVEQLKVRNIFVEIKCDYLLYKQG